MAKIFGLKRWLALAGTENCTKDLGFTQGELSPLHLHSTTELWVMYQALQIQRKETLVKEGQGTVDCGRGHMTPLCSVCKCTCVSESAEMGICNIPTYWDD